MRTLLSLLFLASALTLMKGLLFAPAYAEANCAAESRITHDFDNGARWDLCWESRVRENLVLSDVHYTPPGKEAVRVLGSARLSQLHVAYDDSVVTYNDVTQFGLGGSYLQTLTEADCPTGQLLDVQGRAGPMPVANRSRQWLSHPYPRCTGSQHESVFCLSGWCLCLHRQLVIF